MVIRIDDMSKPGVGGLDELIHKVRGTGGQSEAEAQQELNAQKSRGRILNFENSDDIETFLKELESGPSDGQNQAASPHSLDAARVAELLDLS